MPLPLSIQARGLYTPYYDYFQMKDQSGVAWYWWVTKSHDLDWGLSPRTYSHRRPRELVLTPVPSWLVLVDNTAVTRYAYPIILTGEIQIVDSPPAVGTGYAGSPRVQGMDLHFFAFFVNMVRELSISVN